jgi:RimJ/RimL family protein N-acetyltransferase
MREERGPVYLFFVGSSAGARRWRLPEGYEAEFWHPSLKNIAPVGINSQARGSFALRWLLHYARVFSGRYYCAFVVRHRGKLVHHSGVTPRYWRFPFMGADDAQIGRTWTDPAHRGKGIARYAVQEILAAMARPGRRFWYVVEDINGASIRAAEGAGMVLFARGTHVSRWRASLFSSYVIEEVFRPSADSRIGLADEPDDLLSDDGPAPRLAYGKSAGRRS